MMKTMWFVACIACLAFGYPYFDPPTRDTTVYEGPSLTFYVYAWSWQLNWLHFTMSGAPAGATLSDIGRVGGCSCSATQWAAQFFWTPNYHSAGVYTIYFTVYDTLGVSDVDTMILTVLDRPLAPEIIGVPPHFNTFEDETFVVSLLPYVTDPDSVPEAISWSAAGNDNFSIWFIGHTMYAAGRENWFGTDTFCLIATDPTGLSDTASVILNVSAVDDPPDFLERFPAETVLVRGDTVYFELNEFVLDVDDPFSSLHFHIWGCTNVSMALLDSGILRIIAPEYWFGTETLHISATDGHGLADTASMVLTILCGNCPPDLSVLPDMIEIGTNDTGIIWLDTLFVDPDDPPNELFWSAWGGNHIYVSISYDRYLKIFPDIGWEGIDSFFIAAMDHEGHADTALMRVFVSPTEIGEKRGDDLSFGAAYPNPATDFVFLNVGSSKPLEIKVLDFLGRQVYKCEATDVFRWNGNDEKTGKRVPPGIYFIVINQEKTYFSKIALID